MTMKMINITGTEIACKTDKMYGERTEPGSIQSFHCVNKMLGAPAVAAIPGL